MNTLPIICLGALCLLMAIVYTAYSKKNGWQGLLVRGLAVVSCLALTQVSASLKALSNALPIFVTIGLAVLVLSESLKVADDEKGKSQTLVAGVFNSLGFALIALGGLSLSEFNFFAVLGGIFFGVAFGFIVCAIKKYKAKEKVLAEIFSFTAIGLILGFGLMAVVSSTHILSAICMLGGGVVLLFQKLMLALGRGGKTITAIANFFYIIALTAISLSIYLY